MKGFNYKFRDVLGPFKAPLALFVIGLSGQIYAQELNFTEVARQAALATEKQQIVILGETHRQPQLSSLILSILKSYSGKASRDCLFVEVPTDFQPALDRFMREQKLRPLVQDLAMLSQKLRLPRSLLKKAPVEFQAVRKEIQKAANRPPQFAAVETSPFGLPLAAWLKANGVNLLAYDSTSQSIETSESIYFSMADMMFPGLMDASPRFVAAEEYVRKFNTNLYRNYLSTLHRRNQRMAVNIQRQFLNEQCHRALVIVGLDHLLSQIGLENKRAPMAYSSLAEALQQKDFDVSTLAIRDDYQEPKPDYFEFVDNDVRSDDYDSNVGVLRLPR